MYRQVHSDQIKKGFANWKEEQRALLHSLKGARNITDQ